MHQRPGPPSVTIICFLYSVDLSTLLPKAPQTYEQAPEHDPSTRHAKVLWGAWTLPMPPCCFLLLSRIRRAHIHACMHACTHACTRTLAHNISHSDTRSLSHTHTHKQTQLTHPLISLLDGFHLKAVVAWACEGSSWPSERLAGSGTRPQHGRGRCRRRREEEHLRCGKCPRSP